MGPSCRILNNHWKIRLSDGELMSGVVGGTKPFISPLTFALLEDSGWYQMDYAMTSTLVEGSMWGYKQGCAFVQEKCASVHTGVVQRPPSMPNAFCGVSGHSHRATCSSDARTMEFCLSSDELERPDNVLAQYQYGTDVLVDKSLMDFCPRPASFPTSSACDRDGQSQRCLQRSYGSSAPHRSAEFYARCQSVRCSEHGDRYQVLDSGVVVGVCSQPGQTITHRPSPYSSIDEYICASPHIICAQVRFPHLPATSIANRQVDRVSNSAFTGSGSPYDQWTVTATESDTTGSNTSAAPELSAGDPVAIAIILLFLL